MADGEARVHWAPWAAKWLANAQRLRDMQVAHEERKIKNALRVARWRRARKHTP